MRAVTTALEGRRRAVGFLEVNSRDRLLLRAAVGVGPSAETAWDDWSADVDIEVASYAEGRLLPRVFANLNAQGLGSRLPERMRGHYRWVWANNQLRAAAVAPALRALEDAGVATMLLKGGGLLAGDRCEWGAREMGDVDVLVPAGQAGRAAEILEDAGWRGVHGVTARYLAGRLVTRRHGWNFDGPPSGDVDVHWHAFEGMHNKRADRELWAAARPTVFGGVSTRRLDDTYQLVHTIEHASHGEAAHRLMWLVDVAALLPHVDDARFERFVSSIGVHRVAVEGLAIAVGALDSERAATLRRRLSSSGPSPRERLLARTDDGGVAERVPRLSELVRATLLRSGAGAVLRRRVEPDLVARPALSTTLALLGRPRRVEVALLRMLGPLSRPPQVRALATGQWIDVTPALLDHIGGPGWEWPEPDGAVWSDGAEARLLLNIDVSGRRDLIIQFLLGAHAHLSPNPSIAVLVNGRPVDGWQLGPEPERVARRVRVPAWLVDWCRPLEIVFKPHRAFDPRARDGAPGDRRRFIQLRALRVDVAYGAGSMR